MYDQHQEKVFGSGVSLSSKQYRNVEDSEVEGENKILEKGIKGEADRKTAMI